MQRAWAPPALTYHRAHHIVLHPEAERRFAAAGGRSLGGPGGLSPAAARTPATDPASPVRLLRRCPVGAPGPGRASPGSNARGGSVGCGFPPRHGSEESRASHVVPDSAAQAAASEKLRCRPRARPPVLCALIGRRASGAGPGWPDQSALATERPPGPLFARLVSGWEHQLEDSASPCHGNDPNRASKFRFMTG
ncbi:RIKEN cDNA 4930542C12 [Mus musculus]|uniref:Uncharacterized protein n=2 Tax=Mus musculus TaxID=10090 RepID=Q9D4X9_MOUSE|nr:RIKEN cDNA 4930542C12 [Mus musculus]BAB30081.1 unnamed protein product [Mus musculus]